MSALPPKAHIRSHYRSFPSIFIWRPSQRQSIDNKSFVNAFGFVPYDDRCAQINLPALASARLPASRCAFHKCHA